MTAVPRTARPVTLGSRMLRILVPSRSELGKFREIKFFKGGGWTCNCPAVYWARQRQDGWSKKCYHYRMTTLDAGKEPLPTLEEALFQLKNKSVPMKTIWENMRICSMPTKYQLSEMYCKSCPMYPEWCNVHIITFGKRGLKKPMIWRIQSALLNERRKDAIRLLSHFIKLVSAIRNEPIRRN